MLFSNYSLLSNNFYSEKIPVVLEIDYGKSITQQNLVTLVVKILNNSVDKSSLRLQFSTDNNTWWGYDASKGQWIREFMGEYSSYLPNFNLGNTSGLKTVYLKVVDLTGKEVGSTLSSISYNPINRITSGGISEDKTPPTIEVVTQYHSFLAVEGKLELGIVLQDDLSESINLLVEVFVENRRVFKEGKIMQTIKGKPSVTAVFIEGLSRGEFNAIVTAIDNSGNTSKKSVKIVSWD